MQTFRTFMLNVVVLTCGYDDVIVFSAIGKMYPFPLEIFHIFQYSEDQLYLNFKSTFRFLN